MGQGNFNPGGGFHGLGTGPDIAYIVVSVSLPELSPSCCRALYFDFVTFFTAVFVLFSGQDQTSSSCLCFFQWYTPSWSNWKFQYQLDYWSPDLQSSFLEPRDHTHIILFFSNKDRAQESIQSHHSMHHHMDHSIPYRVKIECFSISW